MKRVNALAKVLTDLEHTSTRIIREGIPLLRKLAEESNDLLEDIVEEKPDADRDAVLELLQNTTLALISDSETVMKELESFSEAVLEGEKAIEDGKEDYPFLLSVWCGDMYDEQRTGGLEKLLEDLQIQLKDIDEDNLYQNILQQLEDA